MESTMNNGRHRREPPVVDLSRLAGAQVRLLGTLADEAIVLSRLTAVHP